MDNYGTRDQLLTPPIAIATHPLVWSVPSMSLPPRGISESLYCHSTMEVRRSPLLKTINQWVSDANKQMFPSILFSGLSCASDIILGQTSRIQSSCPSWWLAHKHTFLLSFPPFSVVLYSCPHSYLQGSLLQVELPKCKLAFWKMKPG